MKKIILSLIFVSVLLTACVQPVDDSDVVLPPPAPVPIIKDTNVTVPHDYKKRALDSVNKIRTEVNLPSLQLDTKLEAAAQAQAKFVCEAEHFTYIDSSGKSSWDRVADTGFKASTVSENIAVNETVIERIIDNWRRFYNPTENMMVEQVSKMGVGLAVDSEGEYRVCWSVVFAGQLN